MKLVRVTSHKVNCTVLLDWENILAEDAPQLGLKKGTSLSVHYQNNKNWYKYEPIPYYTKPYHPQEILNNFLERKPILSNFVSVLDLELTM